MRRKYKFTGVERDGLKQIVSIRNFGKIKKGYVGGWIEKEENLSHEGKSWVYADAKAYGDAEISGGMIK